MVSKPLSSWQHFGHDMGIFMSFRLRRLVISRSCLAGPRNEVSKVAILGHGGLVVLPSPWMGFSNMKRPDGRLFEEKMRQ
jgi:hypothetical protein